MHGDELIELRKYIINLEAELDVAADERDTGSIQHITRALQESKAMDAEHCYMIALENLKIAEKNGNQEEASEYRKESLLARSCLPQFQLNGLWVGKYGDYGYEMVNVTYAGGELGNTLVATKIKEIQKQYGKLHP